MGEVVATRLLDQPLIHHAMSASLAGNVNGPSMIRVPDWVTNPLAKYYLYFAHHQGDHIRLAYADAPAGPWTLREGGVLALTDSLFPLTSEAAGFYAHVASPDVVLDTSARQLRMYYHGMLEDRSQRTRVALSSNGLDFAPQNEILGVSYFRVLPYRRGWFALGMPGLIYHSDNGLSDFRVVTRLFNDDMRHAALLPRGDTLYVFWTQVGFEPERILLSRIDTSADIGAWQASEPTELLRPERAWEGANEPSAPSKRGPIMRAVHELRDPGIFEDEGRTYLLYAVAGEQGLGIAELSGL